ncbi:hypothetical protein BV20DRAFT_1091189 [Pilatotrama ljubarskyi]|nr:hypothetical protein BV20DRAFT_1091189 [Pilatotrama ljubarskyi]
MPPLTPQLLTAILRDLVNVETLKLFDLEYHEDHEPTESTTTARIVLSRLSKLTVMDCEVKIMQHILSVISLSPSATVSISRQFSSDITAARQALLQGSCVVLPADRSGLPVLSHLTAVHVKDSDALRTISGTSPPTRDGQNGGEFWSSIFCHLLADSHAGHQVPVLADFLNMYICRVAPLEVLHVEVMADRLPDIDWPTVLSPFPKLQDLTVTCEGGKAHHVFRGLNPDNSPGRSWGRELVVCPRLEKLRLVGLGTLSDTALIPTASACLEHRWTALG